MNINSYKIKLLLVYIVFMFINSVVPVFSAKSIWRYDKVIHFIEFFILGFLFINAIIKRPLDINKFLIGIFILTLIPVVDEGLQYVFDIPGRVPDFYDFLVDVVGSYVGSLAFIIMYKLRNKNG